jgi:hypothetical protein
MHRKEYVAALGGQTSCLPQAALRPRSLPVGSRRSQGFSSGGIAVELGPAAGVISMVRSRWSLWASKSDRLLGPAVSVAFMDRSRWSLLSAKSDKLLGARIRRGETRGGHLPWERGRPGRRPVFAHGQRASRPRSRGVLMPHLRLLDGEAIVLVKSRCRSIPTRGLSAPTADLATEQNDADHQICESIGEHHRRRQ